MGGLNNSLPSFDGFFWIMGFLILLIIGIVIYTQYEESQTIYEMPNGVMCELKLLKGGGLFSSGSTFHFSECEDGEKYINPEHYEAIRK